MTARGTRTDGNAVDVTVTEIDTPWGPVSSADLPSSGREIQEAILDAAADCFAAQGITATSMGAIAKEAGISRAWLYRNYASRDAIVRAVLARGTERLANLLKAADRPELSAADLLTGAFIRIIRHCCSDRLVREVADQDTGPLARATVDTLEGFLIGRYNFAPVRARVVAETIVRLIISIVTTPRTATDFDNDDELRSFAQYFIQPLLAP